MKAAFDHAALAYDADFTHSTIGKAQRAQVYLHLQRLLQSNIIKSVLEINCGTGEDAIWLSKQSLTVTASDISEKMIAAAIAKAGASIVDFRVLDINDLHEHFSGVKYDLIFSNFGGLNCLSPEELCEFFRNSSELISESGLLALVIMPRNTLWEKLYFLGKADLKSLRRRKKSVRVNVGAKQVLTYYYNPAETISLAESYFEVTLVRPIGFFVPPSYLEPFFENKPRLMTMLRKLDKVVANWSSLGKYADHYLIVFEKK